MLGGALSSIGLGRDFALPAPVRFSFRGDDPPVADLHISWAIAAAPRSIEVTRGKAISLAEFPDPVTGSFFHACTRLLVNGSSEP